MKHLQKGFTLVEIAIVLVIIGLLLGGILKGQELINSARVRNIADTNSGIQAAYYGFIDRYRRVPGDWEQAQAEIGIGQGINSGGNGNGRLDAVAGNEWAEPAAMWEHLWKAGFIAGSYDGLDGGPGGVVPSSTATYRGAGSPTNPFNGSMILARTPDYQVAAGEASTRLNLVMGENIPVSIARELDVKLDDARPLTGVARLAVTAAATFDVIGQSDEACIVNAGDPPEASNDYDIAADSQNCTLVYLY